MILSFDIKTSFSKTLFDLENIEENYVILILIIKSTFRNSAASFEKKIVPRPHSVDWTLQIPSWAKSENKFQEQFLSQVEKCVS